MSVRPTPQCKLCRGDLLCAAVIALIAVVLGAFLLARGTDAAADATVVVTHNGTVVQQVPLHSSVPAEIEVTGDYTNVIVVQDGAVAFVAADCPGEDCVHSGSIRRPGQALVCLPNRVSVTVTGSDGPDVVIG